MNLLAEAGAYPVSIPLRVFGGILLLPGLWIAGVNWACLIHNFRGGKYASPMPLVSLPFLAVGILLLQIPAGWWFLLMVDASSVLTIVCLPWWMVAWWRGRRQKVR